MPEPLTESDFIYFVMTLAVTLVITVASEVSPEVNQWGVFIFLGYILVSLYLTRNREQ